MPQATCLSKAKLAFVSAMMIFGLIGCGTASANAQAETKTKTPAENCQVQDEKNIYKQFSRNVNVVNHIYSANNLRSTDPARPADLRAAQEQTLGYLVAQTRNWSRHRDLGKDEKVRITVTFLHPELMRAILFAQMLNTYSQDDLNNRIKAKVDEAWAKKNRLVFLITVTAQPETNPKVILPIEKIELVSMVGKSIPPERMDGNLGFTIYPSQPDVHFGYVMFYGGIKGSGDVCTTYIDPDLDTSLTVRIPKVTVNEDEFPDVFWFEPLHAVLPIDEDVLIPPVRVAFPDDPGFRGVMEPPLPDFNDQVGSDAYWHQMALFIWGKSIELGLGQ